MPVKDLRIIGHYDVQQFKQFNPEDCANWYLSDDVNGKKSLAMYPTMGRKHIHFAGINQLVFNAEPRFVFKSVNYYYVVVADTIYRFDEFFNRTIISQGKVTSIAGNMFADYLIAGTLTYVAFVDGENMYVYSETTGTFDITTDTVNGPPFPTYVKAFGSRFVVATRRSSQFWLTQINLAATDGVYYPTKIFLVGYTGVSGGASVFAQEAGYIRQFTVLHNLLYIFTDFTTGIWANIPSVLISIAGVETTFPWKKATSYDFDFGIADPLSLDTGFGMMTWLAQNRDGLIQVMTSDGSKPKRISTKAIDVIFQRDANNDELSPFLENRSDGFMYQYENTIFFRLSAGTYTGTQLLDLQDDANSIEYNFNTDSWHRCIEKNGERNRIKKHIYFANRHLVTIDSDTTMYEMSGQFYTNEYSNPDREDPQAADAYIEDPFRYERVTPILHEDDYGELIFDYVEIDFVWGLSNVTYSLAPFENAIFLVDETSTPENPVYLIDESSDPADPTYLLAEEGNTPVIDSDHYNNLFKPHIELYFSDDGGVSFLPADVREFSQLGVYQWRMRWYQLGAARNRCFKLICVSPSPMVVLGGVMMVRRGGDAGS